MLSRTCYAGSVRAGRAALCVAILCGAPAIGCGDDDSSPSIADGAPADAAHRGDTGPLGGPVLDADLVCPSIGQLFDTWDGIDDERWSELRDPADSACTVAVAGGRLELSSADGTIACGLVSAICHDLTDRAVQVDVVQPGEDGVPEPFFQIALAGGGTVEMRVSGDGAVTLVAERDGEPLASAVFDPERHRLWRLMHTAVAERIDLQTAPADGSEWTTLASTEASGEETAESLVTLGIRKVAAAGDTVAFEDLIGIDF